MEFKNPFSKPKQKELSEQKQISQEKNTPKNILPPTKNFFNLSNISQVDLKNLENREKVLKLTRDTLANKILEKISQNFLAYQLYTSREVITQIEIYARQIVRYEESTNKIVFSGRAVLPNIEGTSGYLNNYIQQAILEISGSNSNLFPQASQSLPVLLEDNEKRELTIISPSDLEMLYEGKNLKQANRVVLALNEAIYDKHIKSPEECIVFLEKLLSGIGVDPRTVPKGMTQEQANEQKRAEYKIVIDNLIKTFYQKDTNNSSAPVDLKGFSKENLINKLTRQKVIEILQKDLLYEIINKIQPSNESNFMIFSEQDLDKIKNYINQITHYNLDQNKIEIKRYGIELPQIQNGTLETLLNNYISQAIEYISKQNPTLFN
jgi:hypothetical protein